MTRTEFRALPLLVKPAQAAELLGVNVRKLAEAFGDDVLPPVLTKGGHRRYRKRELARLVGLEDAL
jgi:predicted site-specific integrase-resolvase